MKNRKNVKYLFVLLAILILSTLFSLFFDQMTEKMVQKMNRYQIEMIDQKETEW
ncbi:MAG: hypothetical protein SO267_03545 [Lachnospiraceae bacterium]|nr:hypothetical protein [Lachnospiraceae bacterium]MDY4769794.1 hypothetical protein [Lachnospiraceae bacterium]